MLGVRVKKFQWVIWVVRVFHGPAEELAGPSLRRSQHKVDSPSSFHLGGKGDPLHHPAVSRRLGTDYVRPRGQESPVVSISSLGKVKAQQNPAQFSVLHPL